MSQFKDLRKAAFAVAFGATMGKFAAEMAKAAINGVVVGSFRIAAKEGSEIAKDVCKKSDIKFETKNESEEKAMGFHA